jgi:hypothetical protein
MRSFPQVVAIYEMGSLPRQPQKRSTLHRTGAQAIRLGRDFGFADTFAVRTPPILQRLDEFF